ncbi:MAG: VCBS repeat-containing protein, partial [Acidobacteriales bacterium]|nr:VCBS repeat-containing protein [Terriglobales bacterium]
MKSMPLVPPVVLLLLTFAQAIAASAQIPRFLNTVSYPAPGAYMAVLADVNGDGCLDIVTANGYGYSGAGVSLLLGTKNGGFKPAQTLVPDGNPTWAVVGDFNNDGKLDIAVANEPDPNLPPPVGGPAQNAVSLLLGNGDGTFQASIDTSTAGARFMAAADFNADGKLDLAITGTSSMDQILLGNGDGTFNVIDTSVDGASEAIITGDFNKDGKPDLLTGGWQMLGNGDGTFAFGQALPVSGLQAVADLNGDGIPDLIGSYLTFHAYIAEVAFGSADGTWAPSFISNYSSDGNVVAGSFDGDSREDLFGAGAPPNGGIDPPRGGLFLGNGDGYFTLGATGFGFSLNGGIGGYPA